MAGCEVETNVTAPQSDHGSLSEPIVTGDCFLRSDGGNAVDAGLIDDGLLHNSGSAKKASVQHKKKDHAKSTGVAVAGCEVEAGGTATQRTKLCFCKNNKRMIIVTMGRCRSRASLATASCAVMVAALSMQVSLMTAYCTEVALRGGEALSAGGRRAPRALVSQWLAARSKHGSRRRRVTMGRCRSRESLATASCAVMVATLSMRVSLTTAYFTAVALRRGGTRHRRKERTKSTDVAVAGCEVEAGGTAPQSDHGSLLEPIVTGNGFLRSDGGSATDSHLLWLCSRPVSTAAE